MRKFAVLAALVATCATALTAAPLASAQNNSQQTGLINVSLGNLEILNNVNLALAANVAATVCDVNIAVAALAQQLAGDAGETTCTSEAGEQVNFDQALNGANAGGGGGNNSRQAGLVNVSVGDVLVLNDVNLAVVANVAATVCDLNVAAAILAAQGVFDTGGTVCTSEAGEDVDITQAQ